MQITLALREGASARSANRDRVAGRILPELRPLLDANRAMRRAGQHHGDLSLLTEIDRQRREIKVFD